MATLLNRLRPKKKTEGVGGTGNGAVEGGVKKKNPIEEKLQLAQFIDKRDYIGAISYINFQLKTQPYDPQMELWLGHCYSRAGEFKDASEVFERMLSRDEMVEEVHVYLGICYFFLGLYSEAMETALKGAESPLQARLLFHTAHKMDDEKEIMKYHSRLDVESIEDQLSLASMHFQRMHYEEALNVARQIIENNHKFVAVNFYIALCYYKLDFFENCLEFLKPYLLHYPDSPAAQNLRACTMYKMGNSSVHLDMSTVESLYPSARALFKHNSVVFSGGSNALQVLPGLVELVPEARLNLVIYHLAHNDVDSAYKLVSSIQPGTPTEFLLKAITYVLVGQRNISKEHINTAKQYFLIVGDSSAECDTIAGRQAMAAHHFLSGNFAGVVKFLETIKSFFYNDETFCINYSQALVMEERYEEAISALSEINFKSSLLTNQLLIRSYVMTKQTVKAWEVFIKVQNPNEHFSLLKIIAHDAYVTKQYACTARAYDALEKLDPSPDHWLGKRAAVSGQFALLLQRQCTGAEMAEVLGYLQHGNHSQIEAITNTIRKWSRENGVSLPS